MKPAAGSGTASLEIDGSGEVIVSGNVASSITTNYINTGWIFTTDAGKSVQAVYDNLGGDTVVSVVPEPATIGLLGFGALSLIRCKK
jgi:hypothetical protein